jgi:hypothetical protein
MSASGKSSSIKSNFSGEQTISKKQESLKQININFSVDRTFYGRSE